VEKWDLVSFDLIRVYLWESVACNWFIFGSPPALSPSLAGFHAPATQRLPILFMSDKLQSVQHIKLSDTSGGKRESRLDGPYLLSFRLCALSTCAISLCAFLIYLFSRFAFQLHLSNFTSKEATACHPLTQVVLTRSLLHRWMRSAYRSNDRATMVL
jgi:hypothetical protein